VSFDEELAERYDVLEQVGQGGQAVVVRARDRQHPDVVVALKIYEVPPGTPRDELVNEVDVLLRLEVHPNLPVVRNDFFLGDRYVIVMDWINGPNLQDVLEREGVPGLPLHEVADYLQQLAAALDHLHDSDPLVVHGDVKPANLVLAKLGRVVLVDFGLAGGRAGRGSRGFCAPEVSAGGPATPASDIYAMGATAWALLTGAAPEPGAPPPHVLDPRVVDLLRACLSTSPGARPEGAGEVAKRLATTVGGPPATTRDPSSVLARPPVSDAVLAPTTLIVTGGVAAVTIAIGLGLPVVLGAGALTWAACTVVTRRRHRPEPIRPELLGKEWRGFVVGALDAQKRYERAWRSAHDGPLRERLREIGRSVDAAVAECWTVAKRGDALQHALHELELERARQRLTAAEAELQAAPTPTRERTVASLSARVQSGERMTELLDDARQQLHMLDARLDEINVSALELVHRSGTIGAVTEVGSAVDEVVQELQTLGTALDEATEHTPGQASEPSA
jgi:serine/threonine protein kinase